MSLQKIIGWICFGLILSFLPTPSAAEDITNAISAFLQRRVEIEKRDIGIVVGIVDEHGSSVVSCGKLDNGTDEKVDGDTLFDIASITKPFTGLLLQDMIERGEMKLSDPAQKYLPPSVRMPTRNGKEITLFHLATHTSGLPHIAGTQRLRATKTSRPHQARYGYSRHLCRSVRIPAYSRLSHRNQSNDPPRRRSRSSASLVIRDTRLSKSPKFLAAQRPIQQYGSTQFKRVRS